jgi:hypothetical protein
MGASQGRFRNGLIAHSLRDQPALNLRQIVRIIVNLFGAHLRYALMLFRRRNRFPPSSAFDLGESFAAFTSSQTHTCSKRRLTTAVNGYFFLQERTRSLCRARYFNHWRRRREKYRNWNSYCAFDRGNNFTRDGAGSGKAVLQLCKRQRLRRVSAIQHEPGLVRRRHRARALITSNLPREMCPLEQSGGHPFFFLA